MIKINKLIKNGIFGGIAGVVGGGTGIYIAMHDPFNVGIENSAIIGCGVGGITATVTYAALEGCSNVVTKALPVAKKKTWYIYPGIILGIFFY